MTYNSPNKDNDPTESPTENAGNQSNERSYLNHLVEEMMRESNVTSFDSRTSHMLVDLLQRESMSILKTAAENSEKRISSEREKLLCGSNSNTTLTKPNMNVTEEDAQLACQEYINNTVVQPGILRDILNVQKYANNVRFASKPLATGQRPRAFSSYRVDDEMGQFPTGPPPHLPENISLNTLLPHWDIALKEDKS